MDIADIESQTGLRFSWNIWPPNKNEALKVDLPLSALYTPLKETNCPHLEYEPLRCRQSGSILNPFCQVDHRNKAWICPFSGQRTPFPPKYLEHINTRPPPEMLYTCVDYVIPTQMSGYINPPSIIFVIDTCLFPEELEFLKKILQQTLSNLPASVSVGLVTFGKHCTVHELGFNECLKAYVFQASNSLEPQAIQKQLRILSRDPRGAAGGATARRFLLPVKECFSSINAILENLSKDDWPVLPDHRPERCTGAAISVALALLESCAAQQSGRIMLFVGGACTIGPGQIVGTSLSENLRHHLDLQRNTDNAKYVKKATAFYQKLATRAVNAGHAVDIFACSLDQTGLYEMKVLCDKTGGYVVMSDSFSMNVFTDTFSKIFQTDSSGNLCHAYSAKICGVIGSCSSTNKKSPQVSDTCVGESQTCEWSLPVLDHRTSLAFYFEVANQTSNTSSRQNFFQFKITYNHPSGQRHIRVTTVSYRYCEEGNLLELGSGFDQEAAATIVAKLAVFKAEQEDSIDVLNRFADYKPDDPNSFQLAQQFCLYPGFMYHLRRSHFLQTFNVSPDETAYYRSIMLRENVHNTLLMIQPALFSYQLDSCMQSVQLDVAALKPDVVLLLDSFFHIVVWYGDTITAWKDQGYDKKPEYSNFAELLSAPLKDAKTMINLRFPAPKFVCCNAGGSQARFLLAKVNPSTTHHTLSESVGAFCADNNNFVITDDVSLKYFMEHLIKLAIQS